MTLPSEKRAAPDRHADVRALNRGFGDGMSRAFELAVTPMVFGAMGYGLDQLFDTTPVFALLLGLFGIVGVFVRAWYAYDREMRDHEDAVTARRTVEPPQGDLWERAAGAAGPEVAR